MKKFEKKSYLNCLIATMLVSTLAACAASGPDPAATPVGTPAGAVTSETIGAAGGTLTTPDGEISLTIPAGALAGDADIGILPLTNTAHGGLGAGYRLTPEGQVFQQPVELTISYTDDQLEGSTFEALGVATQTDGGFWEWIEGAVVDDDAQTVTVAVTHFSDFSAVKGFSIRPPDLQLEVGEKGTFIVAYCYDPTIAVGEGDDELQALGYECDIEASDPDLAPLLPTANVLAWKVNGIEGGNGTVGTISGSGPTNVKGTYTAPRTPPDPNTVTVSADLPWKDKGTMIVTAKVTIGQKTARKYEGTIRYSYTGTGQSFTVRGTVTWTEEEAGDDLFFASGTLQTDISLEGCDPFSGSVAISGGEMSFDVPEDGRYIFDLGTESATLSCNGLDLQYVLSNLMLSGSCDGQQPELGDQQTLAGSYACGDGFQLEWSFTLQD